MNHLSNAFGNFSLSHDKEAAVKMSLISILMDDRLEELAYLLTDGHEIGGVEGVPGWLIERRDSGESRDMPGYASWPSWASFRAYVDPKEFALGHPECFLAETEFHSYVRAALVAYFKANPHRKVAVDAVLTRING